MAECRCIKMSLFLIVVLQFTAAANGQLSLFLTVRDGDEVTLSCDSLPADNNNCDFTEWFFDNTRGTAAERLVRGGKIVVQDKSKSDTLSITENCSLVIKKVTSEDVSRYICRQIRSGQLLRQDSSVYLSVVNMSERQDDDEVTLVCSVSTHRLCAHTVKWLFKGQDVDKDNQQMRTSQSPCSASVTFPTSHFGHTPGYNFFKCAVTDHNKVQVFPFSSPRPTGEDTTTATTEQTVTTPGNSPAADQTWIIIVTVVLVALLIIIVAAITYWKRTKRNKTQRNDKAGLTSDPAVTAKETSLDMADPEGDISYASISYTKKATSKAQVRSKTDDGEGDAVTYSTLKASSSDPSNPYIN